MRLDGHHALVTGGGTGIGAAIARALAEEGATVTVLGRRREPIEAVASAIGGTAIAADVTDRDAVEQAFAAAREANGPVRLLVANAGAADAAPFARITPEAWRAAMAVNLDAVFHCCQVALPDLKSHDSARIVTIASTAGLTGFAYTAPYVAAKHGAVGLMRALAAELVGSGITANAVCPGFTDTDIVREAAERIVAQTGRSAEAARGELAKLNASGRLITPDEVARAVVELALSDRNGEAVEVA